MARNDMNVPLGPIATFLGAIALGISSWFAHDQNALAARIDNLQSQQAATAQYAKDTDDRLTRIENKLDNALNEQISKSK